MSVKRNFIWRTLPHKTDVDSRSVDSRSVSSSGSKVSRRSGTPRSVKSTITVKKNPEKSSTGDINFVINQKDQDLALSEARNCKALESMTVDCEEGDRPPAWFEDDKDPECADPTAPTGSSQRSKRWQSAHPTSEESMLRMTR